VSDNPSGEAFVWSGSELLLTHCRHGLDLRLNPRCYLCVTPAATPSPLDDDVDGVDCDWDERGKCRCRVATPAPLDVENLRARITTNLNVYQRRIDAGKATDLDRGKAAAFRVVLSMLDPLPKATFSCGRGEYTPFANDYGDDEP